MLTTLWSSRILSRVLFSPKLRLWRGRLNIDLFMDLTNEENGNYSRGAQTMERDLQGSDDGEQTYSRRWDGREGGTITPFQLPDQTPTRHDWIVHHGEENIDKDYPIGFKECWCFGEVVSKRYYRFDWTQASLHTALGSWTRSSVVDAAHRLRVCSKAGYSYCIRIRGVSITLSGGPSTLQRLTEMALRVKREQLQFAIIDHDRSVSGRCTQAHRATEEEASESDVTANSRRMRDL